MKALVRVAALILACGMSANVLADTGKQITAQAGIDEGGLILGAHFNVTDTANEAYGGYARVYSKDKERGQPTIFAVGASFTGRVRAGIFEYYLTPGFGLMHHTLEQSELLFGPSLAYGLHAELDKLVSLGVENAKLYSWVGEYKGLIKDSFLVQVRFNI